MNADLEKTEPVIADGSSEDPAKELEIFADSRLSSALFRVLAKSSRFR
jgi:hypothetical protein